MAQDEMNIAVDHRPGVDSRPGGCRRSDREVGETDRIDRHEAGKTRGGCRRGDRFEARGGEEEVSERSRHSQHIVAHPGSPEEAASGCELRNQEKITARTPVEIQDGLHTGPDLDDVIAIPAAENNLRHPGELLRKSGIAGPGNHAHPSRQGVSVSIANGFDGERFVEDASIPLAVRIAVTQVIVAGRKSQNSILNPGQNWIGSLAAHRV